ncbi:MAG: hypothetical protein IKW30_08700 [Lachnospiraceae bacterium]|nr:hypothetical protein [Lachnospiraceae bacterium]
MKRRKIIGLVLIVGTFVYFLACLLALYQNQRVTMEKGIEEALKAYSNQETLNIKELSKDFNLLLDDKMDINESKQQIMKFEGSFERMEKNIVDVNDEIVNVEYHLNFLDEKMEYIENYYKELYEEYNNNNIFLEEKFITIDQVIQELENKILNLEKIILESDEKQNGNIQNLQSQIDEIKAIIFEVQGNVIYYHYDEASNTLHIFGNQGENVDEE